MLNESSDGRPQRVRTGYFVCARFVTNEQSDAFGWQSDAFGQQSDAFGCGPRLTVSKIHIPGRNEHVQIWSGLSAQLSDAKQNN
jgi:hypothetical protein